MFHSKSFLKHDFILSVWVLLSLGLGFMCKKKLFVGYSQKHFRVLDNNIGYNIKDNIISKTVKQIIDTETLV